MTKGTTAPRRPGSKPAQISEDLSRKIQEKAFDLFQQRGGVHGDDQADWFEAERIVMQSSGRTAAGTTRPAASRGNGARRRTTTPRRKIDRKAGA